MTLFVSTIDKMSWSSVHYLLQWYFSLLFSFWVQWLLCLGYVPFKVHLDSIIALILWICQNNLLKIRTFVCCRKSRKNRKKSQRKKVSLKQGSENENIALMEALAEIISFVDKMPGRTPSS